MVFLEILILSPQNGFVAYLWGIETGAGLRKTVRPLWVCSLPMRDWNSNITTSISLSLRVCSLPMRDWNWPNKTTSRGRIRVCSLPMRDWNHPQMGQKSFSFLVCSLPMRDWNNLGKIKNWAVCSVCSLPVRDWNTYRRRRILASFDAFVAYLWGIETLCLFQAWYHQAGL